MLAGAHDLLYEHTTLIETSFPVAKALLTPVACGLYTQRGLLHGSLKKLCTPVTPQVRGQRWRQL